MQQRVGNRPLQVAEGSAGGAGQGGRTPSGAVKLAVLGPGWVQALTSPKSPGRCPGSKSLFCGKIESPGHLVVCISGIYEKIGFDPSPLDSHLLMIRLTDLIASGNFPAA